MFGVEFYVMLMLRSPFVESLRKLFLHLSIISPPTTILPITFYALTLLYMGNGTLATAKTRRNDSY